MISQERCSTPPRSGLGLVMVLAMCGFGGMSIPYKAMAFGSAMILGQNNEHDRITQAALGCDSLYDPLTKPAACFEPKTLNNLAGISPGYFSAVTAADDIAMHLSGGPDWWHCDKADYFDDASYPITRPNATSKLLECHDWAKSVLTTGLAYSENLCKNSTSNPRWTFRCEGAASLGYLMLDGKGNVDVKQPASFGCIFNGAKGRIKCQVLQQFGYALHTLQDFYSHSNYADLNMNWPLSWSSIPGIGNTQTPDFWDLTSDTPSSPPLPDERLSSGCYPDSACLMQKRSNHEQNNKDKSDIDIITGKVTNPRTERGKMEIYGVTNTQRAVDLAIQQTRIAWANLQTEIIRREGSERGAKIICAIASDRPNDCGKSRSRSLSMPVAQPELPRDGEPPFDWVLNAYESAALQLEESRQTGVAISQDQLGGRKRVSAAAAHEKWKDCGSVVIDPRPVEVGDDTDTRLVVTRFRTSGVSCKGGIQLVRNKRLSNTQLGKSIKSPLQCIAIPDAETPPNEDALIICKNKNESIRIMFTPDCPDGECGI
jgi:hypothetical protein